MKLNLLAQETLANLRASPNTLTPEELVEKSTITEYSSRLSQVLLSLVDKGFLYHVDDDLNQASYSCEYGVRGIHDEEIDSTKM